MMRHRKVGTLFILATLTVGQMLTPHASAEPIGMERSSGFEPPSASAEEVLLRYVSVDGPGATVHFNEEAAKADAIDPAIVESGRLFNEYADAVHSGAKGNRAKIVIWGNYCGPEHSGPGAPKDLLDAACKKHDECYGQPNSYGSCACDDALIAEINENYRRMHATEKVAATAVKSYFIAVRPKCKK
ncbi:hypothetical protein L1O03_11285 [Corynebacterium uropygiale]|uniref:Phospholipase A2 domain-containing protein n=1 Tax=Corynebacterium uropygiale TaxID=1775911 RepID=A0A9X1U8E5_9CORY|nr:hypothetical protein [Corynebacterium uropygiale]MCF4007747.1 hypothetical protein [Corynebacterium uropygiale]